MLSNWLKYKHRIRLLIRSEHGSVLPLVGLSILALVGTTGLAVDMGRAQLVRSRLSNALDAAGLAAGSTVNTANLNSEVEKYLNTNFSNYSGATINNVSITTNNDKSVISLSATAVVPTVFMQLFGTNSVTVSASSEITRASSGLELVMVLDNTGSMAGPKLASLKTAASDLVGILYGDKTSADDLWIGLVPFAQSVNIGPSRSTWTTPNNFNWGTTSWNGCVDARETGGRDVTDDPPSIATFPQYYWPCHTSYNAWYGTNGSKNNCSTKGAVKYISPLDENTGPNKYCSQELTAMTASKATILNAINNMAARGNTHINLGAVWGWRMLSPRWRGLWGGEMNAHSLPYNYNTPRVDKAAIIMTDGDNTMSDSSHSAYWYLSDNKLGTTNANTAEGKLDTRLSQVCTSMKSNNIIIYTISFGSVSSSIKTLLKNCATQSDYYFDSPNDATLQQAFHAIGDSLSNLRVSK